MATQTTILYDDAERTDFRDVNDTGSIVLRTVWKAGSAGYNLQQLQAAATNAIATLNTAETQLSASNGAWDAATPAQRTALMLGLTRDVRALIRLALNLLDSPS